MWVWRNARDLKTIYQLSGERSENQVVAIKAVAVGVWFELRGLILFDMK